MSEIMEENDNVKINWQNDMNALGNVPATIGHNLFAKMPAWFFLKVTPPFNYGDDDFFDNQIKDNKPMGIPFLKVEFDFDNKIMKVIGHEGRHRVDSITRLPSGNIRNIPVAILYNHDKYPQIPSIEELKHWSFRKENSDIIVNNSWINFFNNDTLNEGYKEEYSGANRVAGFYFVKSFKWEMLPRTTEYVDWSDPSQALQYTHNDDEGYLEEANAIKFSFEQFGRKLYCSIKSPYKKWIRPFIKKLQVKFPELTSQLGHYDTEWIYDDNNQSGSEPIGNNK